MLENYIAKGNIRDSVFEGLIKFYDKKTGKIIIEAYYKNDILNGLQKEYYENGNLKVLSNFSDGKMNGYSYHYDNSGNLVYKTFAYYDIRTGPSLNYNNGRLVNYYYYGLGDNDFFYVNYDSIGRKGIIELKNNNFFFIHSEQLADSSSIFWVGNVNPPKYFFRYSLVTVDKYNKVQETIEKLKLNSTLWYKVKISNKMMANPDSFPAIKIDVTDSINGLDCTMIKML